MLFQVAGGCGLGTLSAADQAGIWGIGVDKDQYNDAKRVLTSGVKRVDTGVFDTVKQVADGKFQGGTDLNFNLANGGMDVGKINPAVPQDLIDKMNELKQQIIDGKVKVPAAPRKRQPPPRGSLESRQWRRHPFSRCGESPRGSPASSPTIA